MAQYNYGVVDSGITGENLSVGEIAGTRGISENLQLGDLPGDDTIVAVRVIPKLTRNTE